MSKTRKRTCCLRSNSFQQRSEWMNHWSLTDCISGEKVTRHKSQWNVLHGFLCSTYFKALNQYIWHSSLNTAHSTVIPMAVECTGLLPLYMLTHNILLPFVTEGLLFLPTHLRGLFLTLIGGCYSKLSIYTLTFPVNQLLLFSPQTSPINPPPCFLLATQMWPHSWPFIVSSSVPILPCFILPEIKIFSKQ